MTYDYGPLITQLQPYIVTAAGTLITIAVGYIARVAKKRWNIDVDQAHLTSFETTVTNVASEAIAKGLVRVEQNGRVTIPDNTMGSLIKAVSDRAPGAVEYLQQKGLTPEVIADRIKGKVTQIPYGPAI